MTQQTPFFEQIKATDVLAAVVTLEGEISRLRAINAELLAALIEARAWLVQMSLQRTGAAEALRMVNAALAAAKGE